MKGGQTDHSPEKTTFKKPTLITVDKYLNWSYLKEKRKKKYSEFTSQILLPQQPCDTNQKLKGLVN